MSKSYNETLNLPKTDFPMILILAGIVTLSKLINFEKA